MVHRKISYFFRSVANKNVNIAYIAKAATRIEGILKKEGRSPLSCEFKVTGKSVSGYRIFKLTSGLFGTLAEQIAEHESIAEFRLALLGWALSACGVKLHKGIAKAGLPIKHRAQFGEAPNQMVVILTARYREKLRNI